MTSYCLFGSAAVVLKSVMVMVLDSNGMVKDNCGKLAFVVGYCLRLIIEFGLNFYYSRYNESLKIILAMFVILIKVISPLVMLDSIAEII